MAVASLGPDVSPAQRTSAAARPARAAPATAVVEGSVSHLDLLGAARELQRAALHQDADALREAMRSFRGALAQHAWEERDTFRHLPPVTQLVVARGQRRLLTLIDDLVTAPPADSACRARVAEVTRQLTRQARLEAGLLSARPATGASGAERPPD